MADVRPESDGPSPEDIVRELRTTFREEAYELLAELEAALLELENSPEDGELIGRVFRAMHTIKGSSGACEFRDIVAFTHEVETVFDRIRNGKAKATHAIINLTLAARDQIKNLLDCYYRGGAADDEGTKKILAALRELAPEIVVPAPAALQKPQQEQAATPQTWRIRFRPHADFTAAGMESASLAEELEKLGPCTLVERPEQSLRNPPVPAWDMVLTTDRGKNEILDAFIFVKEACDVTVEQIDDEYEIRETTHKKIGEILIERGDATPEQVDQALHATKKVGELLVDAGTVPPAVESALAEQRHVREVREHRRTAEASSGIRVATEKLDALVNLVGELVTVQARLSQLAAGSENADLLSVAEQVERLIESLRDNTMSMRMVPIGTMFGKFTRQVRDLSSSLGKEARLVVEGADTELDKTVIDRMSDPLMHIIRNCVDHGIERPEEREAAGKPKCGEIHLLAAYSGSNVMIRVQDDGAGLDAAAIRSKAIERGLISANADLSEEQVFDLIFEPGLTTAVSATDVSGRGVGMDVVRRAIVNLRGTISVESVRGIGTTLTLTLPLTLAIIDGFLTRIGAERFIFPLALVEECVDFAAAREGAADNRCLAHVRGAIVPYVRMRDYFRLSSEPGQYEQIVIVRNDGKRVGFVVDDIIGEQQTVIKSLGKFYRQVEGIAGATILGDGTVALILDVPKLIGMAEKEEVLK
jgi:two-component system chemotaxis sensor kinase CheA